MTVLITLDIRESALIDECRKSSIKMPNALMEMSMLPLGDIMFEYVDSDYLGSDDEPKRPILLIERKSIADLVASIRDGRYDEQGHRLSNSSEFSPHNIVYLIEGPLPRAADVRRMVISAMTSIQYFKGFSIMRTASVAESAEFLLGTADKIGRKIAEGARLYCSPLNNSIYNSQLEPIVNGVLPVVPYCSVVKKVKKENITSRSIGSIMLCAIPGISAVIATAIMDSPHVDGSMTELLRLLSLPDVSLIENIEVGADPSLPDGPKRKTVRKVGKANVAKMKELLVTGLMGADSFNGVATGRLSTREPETDNTGTKDPSKTESQKNKRAPKTATNKTAPKIAKYKNVPAVGVCLL